MSLTEHGAEPIPPVATPAAESAPSHNGEEETALARMVDEGGLPLSDPVELGLPPPELSAPPAAPVREAPPAAAPIAPTALAVEDLSLEQRIRRVEDALAQIQEQQGIETRIARQPAAPSPASPPPAAPPAPPAATAILLDVGKRILGVAAPAPAAAPTTGTRARAVWFLWDTWAEARAIVHMFVDPRYHLSWSARIFPIALLAAILTSKYWIPGSSIPVLGEWLLVKLVDTMLAFVLFKWLGHEARRYRQSSPDLPPSLRL